jgi:hypothetical protein
LVLGEESFRNSFLDDNFHKFGVVIKVRGRDVLKGLKDLLNFIFQNLLELTI